MITIYLNNRRIELETAMTLYDVITREIKVSTHFAVALNRKFIPRCDYDSCMIANNDSIEIITAMQGG